MAFFGGGKGWEGGENCEENEEGGYEFEFWEAVGHGDEFGVVSDLFVESFNVIERFINELCNLCVASFILCRTNTINFVRA